MSGDKRDKKLVEHLLKYVAGIGTEIAFTFVMFGAGFVIIFVLEFLVGKLR